MKKTTLIVGATAFLIFSVSVVTAFGQSDADKNAEPQTAQEANKQIKLANNRLVQLKKSQKLSDKDKSKREAELIKLNDQLDSLKQSIAEAEGALKGSEDVAKTERDDSDQARKALERLKRDKEDATSKIAKYAKESSDLKKSHDRDVADSKKEEAELKLKSAEADKQQVAFEKERVSVDKEVQRSKKESEKLQALAESKEKAMKVSRDALKKAKDDLSDAKNRRDKLNKDIANAESDTKKLEEERHSAINETQMIKSENGKLESRGHQADETRANAEKQYKAVSAELGHYKEINKNKEIEVKKKESQVKDLEGLVEAGKEEVEKAKKEREDLIKRDTHAEISKGRLQAQADLLKHQYENLTAEIKTKRSRVGQ